MKAAALTRWATLGTVGVAILSILAVTQFVARGRVERDARQMASALGNRARLHYMPAGASFQLLDGATFDIADASLSSPLTCVLIADLACGRCKADAPTWRAVADYASTSKSRCVFIVRGDSAAAERMRELGKLERSEVGYSEDTKMWSRLGPSVFPYVLCLDRENGVVYRDGLPRLQAFPVQEWFRFAEGDETGIAYGFLTAIAGKALGPVTVTGAVAVDLHNEEDPRAMLLCLYRVQEPSGHSGGWVGLLGVWVGERGTTAIEAGAVFDRDGVLRELVPLNKCLLLGTAPDWTRWLREVVREFNGSSTDGAPSLSAVAPRLADRLARGLRYLRDATRRPVD